MNCCTPAPEAHIGAYTHVPTAEIVYCEGDSNYSRVYFRNRRPLVVSTTLGILEARLIGRGFMRVNRSALVNPDCIRNFDAFQVTLLDGRMLPIARRRRVAVWQWLNGRLENEDVMAQLA